MTHKGEKTDSIYFRIIRLLVLAFLIAALFFLVLNQVGNVILESYFTRTNYAQRENIERIADLEKYVKENRVSAVETEKLTRWVKKQSVVWLLVYRDNRLLYDSKSPYLDTEEYASGDDYYGWESSYPVEFQDGPAMVFLFGMYTYQFYNYAIIAEILLSFLLFVGIVMRGIYGYVKYIRKLSEEIGILEGGDLDYKITISGNDELTVLADGLDHMRSSIREQIRQEAELTRMNKAIITNLSHDLRTPLTSLLIYIEILKKFKYKDEKDLQKYIEKIDGKAHQIKEMADNILEYSLGRRCAEPQIEGPRSFRAVFYDPVSETCAYLEQRGYEVLPDIEWSELPVCVDPDYVTRILDNITSNIIKYARKDGPVRISTVFTPVGGGFCFKNEKAEETGSIESTRIGVKNIKEMMERMEGTCVTEESEKEYKIILMFRWDN